MNKGTEVKLTHAQRMEAAERYIESDKSDPFCRARVMSHMKNGIASFKGNGEDAFYTADKIDNGYFTNIARP